MYVLQSFQLYQYAKISLKYAKIIFKLISDDAKKLNGFFWKFFILEFSRKFYKISKIFWASGKICTTFKHQVCFKEIIRYQNYFKKIIICIFREIHAMKLQSTNSRSYRKSRNLLLQKSLSLELTNSVKTKNNFSIHILSFKHLKRIMNCVWNCKTRIEKLFFDCRRIC